jgi:tetratricopeptide (TPR) repeat protein
LSSYYEQQNPAKVAIVLEWIGITFEQQGHFSEALEKYQEALRLFKQYSNESNWSRTERNIARVKGKMKGQLDYKHFTPTAFWNFKTKYPSRHRAGGVSSERVYG